MTILHVNIADADRHEPKGISTATAGQVYKANGSASGAWTSPVYGELLIDTGANTFTPAAASITTFKQLTTANNASWAPGIYSGLTINTNDVTCLTAGNYEVSFWASIVTAAATGTTFAVKYGLDGTLNTRQIIVQKNSSSGDVIPFSASGIVSVTTNQVISVWMASSAATGFIIQNAGLSVVKLS
jgi:hypothetical protein